MKDQSRRRRWILYHAQVRVSYDSQDIRLLHLDGAGDYVWSVARLLVKHYQGMGCQARSSHWRSTAMDTLGDEREMEQTLLAGDDLPF